MINNHMQQYPHPSMASGEGRIQGSGPKKRYWTAKPRKNVIADHMSLVEAARLEMAVVPSKTPVTILQELLSKRGTAPKYELVQIEGAIHEPTFRYRVAFGDTVASGTGRSKKEAKHAAAKNILDKLVGNPVVDEANLNGTADAQCQILRNYDDKIPGNPIGTLQEMCMARRWPPPTYEMTSEEGPPHERQFTIACVLLKYREIGTGKSKKSAKRQAANKMWEKLQEYPPDSSQLTLDIGQRVGSASARYGDLKNSKISTLTTPHSQKVSMFHKNLKQSTGVKLTELHTAPLNGADFDFVQFLQEIATEQQFEVTYVDIEEKSLNGMCQCLVQLSTFPVAVCHGSAETSKEAQAAAAQNALEYLRIMTKK
ncbi:UNVERIFIED_CONTAM: hypothetical protein PYX00_010128 [Menopon gallinae]|uniref:DRBM domain-containing protein n=1 Tax=Menopon gallinae TaxID=328185 RepID=A0AAW2HEB7_9NEOP